MKLKTLLATSVLMSAQAMATQTFVKPLDDGMDQAILESFNDAISSSAIDEVNGIGLDKIKNAIATLRINNNQFEITFDDNKLKSLLSANGIAQWSGLSDPVLVWLAHVSEEGTNVVTGDGVDPFAVALNEASNKNSYDLMFPVMDLDDVQNVNAQTILSHSDKILATASKRYNAKYFVAGAIEGSDDSYAVKWNAYDEAGKALGSGQCSGTLADTTSQMSREVAKVLMQNIDPQANQSQTSADEVQDLTQTSTGGEIYLGPTKGGVIVQLNGVDNVADYPRIKRILITYGYEADIEVLGYNNDGVIFMIPTGSNPAILDGTLAHAGEFTKVADWTYNFNKSNGVVSAGNSIGTVERSNSQRVTSNLNGYGGKAYTTHKVDKTVEVTTKKVMPKKNSIELTDDSGAEVIDGHGVEVTP